MLAKPGTYLPATLIFGWFSKWLKAPQGRGPCLSYSIVPVVDIVLSTYVPNKLWLKGWIINELTLIVADSTWQWFSSFADKKSNCFVSLSSSNQGLYLLIGWPRFQICRLVWLTERVPLETGWPRSGASYQSDQICSTVREPNAQSSWSNWEVET